MTIKYSDGRTIEGVILASGDGAMRVALKGADDAVDFAFMAGTWVSDDGEPIVIEYAWQQHAVKESVSEADCICPKELASRLIHLLLNGDGADVGTVDMPFTQH